MKHVTYFSLKLHFTVTDSDTKTVGRWKHQIIDWWRDFVQIKTWNEHKCHILIIFPPFEVYWCSFNYVILFSSHPLLLQLFNSVWLENCTADCLSPCSQHITSVDGIINIFSSKFYGNLFKIVATFRHKLHILCFFFQYKCDIKNFYPVQYKGQKTFGKNR